MKIRLVGFRLELNPALSFAELVTKLASRTGQPTTYARSTWIMTVKDHGKYTIGSLVAVKGQRKFPQIDVHSLRLSVKELEEGKCLACFNFFVISKRNLNGLYSYYSGSTTVPSFANLLDAVGKTITGPRRTAALKAVQEKGIIGRAKKQTIREKYKYAVQWSYLVSKQNLGEILSGWERLKALEYTVTHLEPGSKDYGTLKPFVRAKKTRLSFERDSVIGTVRKALLQYVEGLSYDQAKVEGVDESGTDRTINLLDTPDWFGEHDYSTILGDSTLFVEDVSQCCLVKLLIQEAENNPAHFAIDVQ